MFATPAQAQTAASAPAAPAAGSGGLLETLGPLPMIAVMAVVFYFLIIRPQQARAKAQQAKIAGIQRGDTVVMSSGVIGKVVRVEDKELLVEIAVNTQVKVVRSMVTEVRPRDVVAANDGKA